MKKANIILVCIILLFVSVTTIIIVAATRSETTPSINSQPEVSRQTLQLPITSNNDQQPPSIPASKLPQFTYSLADQKFNSIVNAASDQIKNLVEAKFVSTAYAEQSVDATVSVNQEKKQLVIQPKSIATFTPGMYKLSLTLRTLEGKVNIDQDFTWGVIAVNTNKSIYKPGETAKIGIGVLNDKGETQCMKGMNRVDDVTMTITDPQGNPTNFSIQDKTIIDSGKCGPTTVTNQADFQATYQITNSGIYQMKVSATVRGEKREIEDYFKVDPNVQFDVERTSFPTRIYPPALYPVTITITSAQDYQGTIEDIIPASFTIEHIDGNGKSVQDSNFTRIVWNTKLIAGKAQTFSYFIKFPMVSPEFYLVGPLKIGSFEETRQWQIASDALNLSTGLFTAEDNSGAHTWYRIWTGSAWSPAPPTAPTSMSATPQDSRWFTEKASPLTGEKLVGIIDNNNSTGATPIVLYLFRWDGSTWNADITLTLVTTAVPNWRYTDLEYEQNSGNAMFAWCDPSGTNPNQIHYRYKLNGSTTWAAEKTAGTATSPKAWIKMTPLANTDSILVGYLNTSNLVGAMIWNGDAGTWNDEIVDNAGTTTSGHADETFAIAWERSSGAAMILWANGSTSITYRRFTGSSWTAESTTGLTGFAANVDWVSASADDTSSSNYIAMASMNTGATPVCNFAIWDGSTWTKRTSSTITCNANTERGIGVAFEHNTGKAIWVFITSAANKQLSYLTWTNALGFDSSATLISGSETNRLETVELYSDFNTVGIICLFTTVTSGTSVGVLDTEWDGSTWTSLPTLANALFGDINTEAENDEAFGYGFDHNIETLAAYRWFNNQDSYDVGSPLTTQNTPYTFSTANPDFRIRLLLYVTDNLAISGRTFTLQFVDPGTGTCSNPIGGTPSTWTNVGTGSSTLIAFKDNASETDGSNLTSDANDPTYPGSTAPILETYEESNDFVNSRNTLTAFHAGEWDFSLHDNSTYDRVAQTFCFRVIRNNLTLIITNIYPQMTTAAVNDVQIQGGSLIQGGTTLK